MKPLLSIEVHRNQHAHWWKLFNGNVPIARSARTMVTYDEAVADAKAFLSAFNGQQHYVAII